MLLPEPYFMKNPEWYYHDDNINRYFLTDKAPKEARESYKQFYEDLEENDPVTMYVWQQVVHDKSEEFRKQGLSEEEIKEEIRKFIYDDRE